MLFTILFKAKDLWTAAKRGDVEAIERLVQDGHDVNAKKRTLNIEGSTPLHIGAAAGQAEAVRALIKLGARVDAKDDRGGTPLRDAVAEGRGNVVSVLLDLGAKINEQDRTGHTALDIAALYGNEHLTELLLKRGANPNQERRGKKSEVLTNAIEGKNPKVFEMLLAAGARPGISGDVSPAIQTAAIYGYSDYVEQLLKAGADPNTRDSSGFPTITCAVRGKKLKILESLINAGADVNSKDSADETALDIAYEIKRKDMIELLEKSGGKRGSELPKDKSAELDKKSTWQLRDDSDLTAWIEPWPPVPGKATLKVIIVCEPELAGGWQIEYRLRSEADLDRQWARIFPAQSESDSDEDEFEAEIDLIAGTWVLEFSVAGRMHKEPDVLSDWKIKIP
jgi:ankyrin repeat protein